jgi:hypothetical protein
VETTLKDYSQLTPRDIETALDISLPVFPPSSMTLPEDDVSGCLT